MKIQHLQKVKSKTRVGLLSFLAFVVVMPMLVSCSYNPLQMQNTDPHVVLNTGKGKSTVNIEIADTFDQRKRGLMFRPTLADGHGMFFVFPRQEKLDFWMKNTLIPLDMVFIDGNYKVVNVAKNVQPCETMNCAVYSSTRPAQYVLEINGGAADKYGLVPGDKVDPSKD